jgi:hypothetical protein
MIEGFRRNIGVQGLSVSLGLRQLALKDVELSLLQRKANIVQYNSGMSQVRGNSGRGSSCNPPRRPQNPGVMAIDS